MTGAMVCAGRGAAGAAALRTAPSEPTHAQAARAVMAPAARTATVPARAIILARSVGGVHVREGVAVALELPLAVREVVVGQAPRLVVVVWRESERGYRVAENDPKRGLDRVVVEPAAAELRAGRAPRLNA